MMKTASGICKWRFGLVEDKATGLFTVKTDIADAIRAQHGVCPLCGGGLVARKGETKNEHWAHLAGRLCDPWYEPKGAWHRYWQGLFPKEWQEVPVVKGTSENKHIADIKGKDGWVIECQYSHIDNTVIRSRERFYDSMVWIVSGTRLVRGRKRFEPLMRREFVEKENLYPYVTVRSGILSGICDFVSEEWTKCKKHVFFDFEGTFDEPSTECELYCLLPDEYNGSRMIVRLPQEDLVSAMLEGEIWDLIGHIEMSMESYAEDCLAEQRRKVALQEEFRRKQSAIREERRKRELANPVRYAVTRGWVEGWMCVHEHEDYLAGVRPEDVPGDGRVAIHIANEYSIEDYKHDREIAFFRKGREFWQWHSFPQYSHLERFRGAIVGIVSVRPRKRPEGEMLWIDFAHRLNDMTDGYRIVRGVADRDGVWPLTNELVSAVNDRAFRQTTVRGRKASPEKVAVGANGMIYTGKGNLYRDMKSGWLHILKDGRFVPLKKENQNWDKTYDAKFAGKAE